MNQLTPEQSKAAKAIESWIKGGDSTPWSFSLSGWAGTGKTFLLGHILNNSPYSFYCCAPTGKAASVLQRKLNGHIVTTVHQLLYNPRELIDPDLKKLYGMLSEFRSLGQDVDSIERSIRKRKKELGDEGEGVAFETKSTMPCMPNDIIVVDEASMVDERMREDFKKIPNKVLFVGDSGQLNPVNGKAWFGKEPDATLTEIQRQALDSPIIRLSADIRTGSFRASDYTTEACRFIPKSELPIEAWLEADQILTGTNASRQRINRFFRKQRGWHESHTPVRGDKLICLKNDYKAQPIRINGEIMECMDTAWYDKVDGFAKLGIVHDGRELPNVEWYDFHCLSNYQKDIIQLPRQERAGLLEIDFAYAITVHKSQGSEWDSVIVADDGFAKRRGSERKQWLYTAVTRAKTNLTIVS